MLVFFIIAICVLFGASYLANVFGVINFPYPSPVVALILYCVTYFLYIRKYRRENIVCFETFFMLISGVCYFYNIILPNSDFFGVTMSAGLKNKALSLEMLATGIFYLGCIRVNNKRIALPDVSSTSIGANSYISWTGKAVNFVSIITILYYVYLFYSGQISDWFIYTDIDIVDSTAWQSLNNTAYLINLLTILEFCRLYELGVDSFKLLLKKINKVFILILILDITLLLVSGNRGDLITVALPFVGLYAMLIKRIPNSIIILGLVGCWLVFVLVGLTRGEGTFSNIADAELSIANSVRDFGPAYFDTQALIDYTDSHGHATFGNIVLSIASMVPFLGGFMKSVFQISSSAASSMIATEYFLGSYNGYGLGTGLIGDLYYHGGLLFIALFMYILGYLASKTYNKCISKNYNIWTICSFSVLLASSFYYPRAGWSYCLRFLGFELLMILISKLIFEQKHAA